MSMSTSTIISYECHPDLLLCSLLDDESDYFGDHEEDDGAVDPILQLMYRYSIAMSKGRK